ncbi:hypothetical protein HCU40_05010 [Pseudanabaena biceps]|nr:hypothetical protein [Pseudanabaena biceps]
MIASSQKSNSDRPSTHKTMIASTRKSNSDRIPNSQYQDRLSKKIK